MNVPNFFIISVITVSFRLYPSTENYGAIKRRLGTTISVYHSIRHITLHCLVETTWPLYTSLVASGPNLEDCLRKLINQSNKQYNFGHIATERIHHFTVSVVGDVMSLSLSLLSDATRRPKRTFVIFGGNKRQPEIGLRLQARWVFLLNRSKNPNSRLKFRLVTRESNQQGLNPTMASRSSSGRQSSPLVLVVTAVCLMLLNLMFLVFVSRIDSRVATLERKQSDVRSSSRTKNHEVILAGC